MKYHRVDIEKTCGTLCATTDNVSYIRKIIGDYAKLPLALNSTSVNCEWCILKDILYIKAIGQKAGQKKGDHPFIDIINGIVLNKIAPEISMQFIDCFYAYKDGSNLLLNPQIGTHDNCKQCIDTQCINVLKGYRGLGFNPNATFQSVSTMEKVSVIISKAIHGSPLNQFIASITDNDSLGKVLFVLNTFIMEYTRLYHLHGIMHNDLHFNNIYYDTINNKLIIIDYGRMTISSMKSLSIPLLDKFNVEIKNVISSLYIPPPVENMYCDIMDKHSVKPILNMCECSYYLMDCMTIAGNLFVEFNLNVHIKNHYTELFECIQTNICDIERNRSSRRCVLYTYPTINLGAALKCIDTFSSYTLSKYEKNIWKFIVQGLYLISKACIYIHLRNPKFDNLSSTQTTSYQFDLYNKKSPLYAYFQWQYNHLDFKIFLQAINYHKDERNFLIGAGRKSIMEKCMEKCMKYNTYNTFVGGANSIAGTLPYDEKQKARLPNTFITILQEQLTNAIIEDCINYKVNIKIGKKEYNINIKKRYRRNSRAG